jgi:hypothetical protein
MRGQGVATPLWEEEVLPGILNEKIPILMETRPSRTLASGRVGPHRVTGEAMAFNE